MFPDNEPKKNIEPPGRKWLDNFSELEKIHPPNESSNNNQKIKKSALKLDKSVSIGIIIVLGLVTLVAVLAGVPTQILITIGAGISLAWKFNS